MSIENQNLHNQKSREREVKNIKYQIGVRSIKKLKIVSHQEQNQFKIEK
jgi:hypothetical protein